MSPLQLRKQILLAESELNRAQFGLELSRFKTGVRSLTERAQSFDALFSSAAVLLTAVAAFERGKPVKTGAKRSWLQTFLKGAGFISTLWLAFQPWGRKSTGK